MTPAILVLGGSSFVGRAVVDDALARGWRVTTFNRGRTWTDRRVERILGDRLDPRSLEPLARREWTIVVDTWMGTPRAARDSARLLAPRAARYAYVSSRSVYVAPPAVDADESWPTVDASPNGEAPGYAESKRGTELAIAEAFGERALLARPGLILGPHEDVGRLPWWLLRMHAGGEILAPGPPGLPLQYIDARDLARFLLQASMDGRGGPFNLVTRRGHATMASLLEACRRVAGAPTARLTWIDPEPILRAGVQPWTDLPIWIPPEHEYAAMHATNVDRAHAAGLRCRPIEDTVADTWAWLRTLGGPPPTRADRDPPGLPRSREDAILAAWHARRAAG